ncbi:6,7-dimethyl-8-ribityllumazine synthase [Lactobacillus sp. ESL0703]|uniref:6,7-dimethyl-8-ribityllumazine synthase n=1 Tax=Lactobacillus sp. ESL0703 TaxID=2983218 RepID=UPI0023F6BC31|nr:6,7-dimethyl-8-ribityllumazine synthase [Lactobacillus sp. ESL0703]MDF7669106.1 6,7-dimethyl-8-ribityllumazine synthase [Lactobacillus sp. ESL0703]
MKEITGKLVAGQDKKIGIVVAKFNGVVTDRLLNGAIEQLEMSGVASDNIVVVHVPGAYEIARTVNCLAKSGKVDGIIALGAVIRGETDHYTYVCEGTASQLAAATANGPVPVMFGVLMTDTVAQATDRAGGKSGNKGAECATDILEVLSLEEQINNL